MPFIRSGSLHDTCGYREILQLIIHKIDTIILGALGKDGKRFRHRSVAEAAGDALGMDGLKRKAHQTLVYENAELQNILTPIAGHFHLQVTYQNESARHIRLFLQLEKNMSLDDIIELMNHFEKVNIRHEGQTLIVE